MPGHVAKRTNLRVYEYNQAVDLTGSAADIAEFVPHLPGIDLVAVGFSYEAAGPNEATLAAGTAGVVSVEVEDAAGVRTEVGEVSVEADKDLHSFSETDLDGNKDNLPIPGPKDYPLVLKGVNRIHLVHKTQGSGGTQSVRPYILYTENDAV